MRRHLWLALALTALLAACVQSKPPAAPPDHLVLTPASFGDLKGWTSDSVGEALAAFKKSCTRRLRFADDAPVGPQGLAGKVADWRAPCAAAASLDEGDSAATRQYFEAWFRPYRCANNDATEGLFTGYYEPELRGSRARGGAFQTPLMKRPPDLVAVDLGDFRADWRGERIAGRVVDGRLKPYETRAQIEAGGLDRLNLGFLWVDDPVAAFFLQIQGSGRINLPDGGQLRVGFDGQNGWPYVAIGRVMIERGLIDRESATMPGIRAWLAAHPPETKDILDANPSYVFFREIAGEGPIGSEGVALTPGRSLAVDTKFLPLGAPFWLDATGDDGPIAHLLIAQDTGGAIRGPVRGDVFWGHGPDAERRAGTMRARGGYFLLLPKTVVLPMS
jgi:peptidoglycan lytic transglycosylase A